MKCAHSSAVEFFWFSRESHGSISVTNDTSCGVLCRSRQGLALSICISFVVLDVTVLALLPVQSALPDMGVVVAIWLSLRDGGLAAVGRGLLRGSLLLDGNVERYALACVQLRVRTRLRCAQGHVSPVRPASLASDETTRTEY